MSAGDHDFYLMTLHFLIIWARESDIFIRTKKKTVVIQRLFSFLLTKVKKSRDSPEIMRMYWLVLMNGWDTIVSTLEEKGRVMEVLL